MNVHNKLRDLGFIKTDFYKINDSMTVCKDTMVLDNYERKLVYDAKGKHSYIEVKKNHPKSNSFWKFIFNEQYVLWISVVRNKIATIILEDKNENSEYKRFHNRKDAQVLYTSDVYIKGANIITSINSKNDILKVLPNHIKREFILKEIIK